ncbi:MAG TPA: 16S rRNA (cytosine(1402)-N(4))-methyltransferase RsmH [Terriglobales bacterium]|nr:16S rRNA (cytosine(1402)-N(4))-methyltransferase RsmH [Terriglobales bacterium]
MTQRDDEEFGTTNAPQGAGHGRESKWGHVPVLLKEAIDFLTVRRGGTYIDGTLGLGGHSFAIAKLLGPQGHLIAIDKDPKALEIANRRLSTPPAGHENDWPRITLLHGSFAELGKHVPAATADGVLADLGINSMQLEDAARGFSFQAEGPLDMRMNTHEERTADQVVNHMNEEDLANVIYEFGEERRSRRIARAIVRARPVSSTAHLAQVISAAARPMKGSRLHPATLTFQGIRIFVNRELDDVRALVTGKTAAAPLVLKPNGRLVVISFHSLEDRIVKDAFREGDKGGWYEMLTKKPVIAGYDEIDRNPRARSAKLRAAVKV